MDLSLSSKSEHSDDNVQPSDDSTALASPASPSSSSHSSSQSSTTACPEAPKKAKCHICGKQGFTDQELSLHVRKYHKVGAFRCSKCSLPFRSRSILQRHLASVHDIGDSKFLCQKCAFCTVRRDHVKAHMKRHHPDSPDSFVQVAFHLYDRTHKTNGNKGINGKCGIGNSASLPPSDLTAYAGNSTGKETLSKKR